MKNYELYEFFEQMNGNIDTLLQTVKNMIMLKLIKNMIMLKLIFLLFYLRNQELKEQIVQEEMVR